MVKLQIKIKHPIYEGMQNLARVLHIAPTECHELAMQQFLVSNGFHYNSVLKTYVLVSETITPAQDALMRIRDVDKKSSPGRKASKDTNNDSNIISGIFGNNNNNLTEKGKRQ